MYFLKYLALVKPEKTKPVLLEKLIKKRHPAICGTLVGFWM